MIYVISLILYGVLGAILANCGIKWNMWEFWVIFGIVIVIEAVAVIKESGK